GADHPVPPAEPLAGRAVAIGGREPVAGALLGRRLSDARRVGVTAERMAHQDDVVAPRREGAVGLVRHANRVQVTAAVEPNGLRQVEVLRLDSAYAGRAGGAGRERRGWLRHGGYLSPSPAAQLSSASIGRRSFGAARGAMPRTAAGLGCEQEDWGE